MIEPPRLTVAVLTFRRPDDLQDVVPMLLAQAATVRSRGVQARVLVVDNDPDAGARAAVEAWQRRGRSAQVDDLHYAHEPVPGISAARNRALAASSTDDLLVFIDDDERPGGDGWLGDLLDRYWSAGEPAAVVGPVVSRFEIEPDDFVLAGRFFERRRLASGTEVDVAATNNLLLDLSFVRQHGLAFDLEFGITGGDDTMFTKEIRSAGGRIVWCQEAGVVDVVPADRLTRSWVLRRALSSGNSWSLTSIKCCTSAVARARLRLSLSAQGTLRVAGGAVRWTLGAATRRLSHRARGLRTAARGVGMISGAWGYRYHEYRRPPTKLPSGGAT